MKCPKSTALAARNLSECDDRHPDADSIPINAVSSTSFLEQSAAINSLPALHQLFIPGNQWNIAKIRRVSWMNGTPAREARMNSDGADAEQELIRRLKTGDVDALGELMDCHGENLMRYLHAILGRKEMAEDVFQDTWLRVMQKAGSFRTGNPVAPWLFRIARNHAYDMLRRDRNRWLSLNDGMGVSATAEEADAQGFSEQYERRELVERLLPKLDPGFREILWLRFFHDESYDSLAKILGIPIGTVKSRLRRALDQLASVSRDLEGVNI